MLEKMRNMVKQKGQGIVEYALLLAFIVAIAMMLNGSNIGGAVKGVFDGVSDVLAGEEQAVAAKDWGHMNPDTDFNDANQAERLKVDQKALENFASFFLDKTEAQVKALLSGVNNNNNGSNNSNDPIGWFVQTPDGAVHFLTKNLAGTDEYDFVKSNGSIQKRAYNDVVFNWMQGDYGNHGLDSTNGYNLSYDNTNHYLVSDYATGQYKLDKDLAWGTSKNWGPEVGGNGVKLKLTYGTVDDQKVVTKATIAIDKGSQTKTPNSSGLEMTVEKGKAAVPTKGFGASPL